MIQEPTSLYVVPTPIGNLGDITFRAVDVLKNVDLILAEDTRTSGVLLKHYDIKRPLKSFHSHNEHAAVEGFIRQMKDGSTLALISDAGTPGVSDPGFLIVRACLEANLKVECLPGATAFIPALVKSGLPCDSFAFEGFLPQKKGKQTQLKKLAEETRTIILYESPYRLVKTLEQFSEYIELTRKVSISRELTKIYEETFNGTLEEAIIYFKSKDVKGEIVLILAGKETKTK